MIARRKEGLLAFRRHDDGQPHCSAMDSACLAKWQRDNNHLPYRAAPPSF